ncbi:hypothetical protein SMICM304S_05485 [Streptomyces microflavus]
MGLPPAVVADGDDAPGRHAGPAEQARRARRPPAGGAARRADGRTGRGVSRPPAPAGPPAAPEFVGRVRTAEPPAGTPTPCPGAGAAGAPDEGPSAAIRAARGGPSPGSPGPALAVVEQVADDSAGREAAAARGRRVSDRDGARAPRAPHAADPRHRVQAPRLKPLSYAERMAQPAPARRGPGRATGESQVSLGWRKAPARAEAPLRGIDVEKGLSLDAGLFAKPSRRRWYDGPESGRTTVR